MKYNIPRIVIGAVSSSSGKTTVVTGILAALRQRGINAQAYKIGPDYIDPGYHALASGRAGHNLDSWLVQPEKLKEIFVRTASRADVAVIEGVMGLYDGGRQGVSSTAEIAKLLDAPVLLVIDAKSMGASAAAIALGFKEYDRNIRLAGVILNRLGSSTHEAMIVSAMENIGVPVLGAIRRDGELTMPERHLGLLPTEENKQQLEIVDKIGQTVGQQVKLTEILKLAKVASPIEIDEEEELISDSNNKDNAPVIAVARDEAFSFYYPESLGELERQGARVIKFSPLHDKSLPICDGIIFGGGFPEMFARSLRENIAMMDSIRLAAAAGKPIYAECGGFMYLTSSLIDFDGKIHAMNGIIPCQVQMNNKLQMVGYVEAKTQVDTILGPAGTTIKGHEFHFSSELEIGKHSVADNGFQRAFEFTRMRNGAKYLAGYANKNIVGSYLHIHFAGCPQVARNFVNRCILTNG